MPHVPIDDFMMYYEVIGKGTPVVCLTGWGTGAGHGFASYPRELLDEFQLIVYDHRGIGRSIGGLGREPSTHLYADDVRALLTALGIPQAHLYGRGGLGGCIAQQVALRHPDIVISAILGQSWAYADPLLAAQFDALYQLRLNSFESFQSACATMCYLPDYFATHHDDLLGPQGSWADIRYATDGHLALIDASRTHNTIPDLPQISCPTLIIQSGPHDWITGPRLGAEVAGRIPAHEMLYLPDAPHAISTHPESATRLTSAVMNFLRKSNSKT
ncbi:alpha/beta hydrolase fold protein (plasmid) [Pseudonocardia dioxanivorans CB1190]|uniref:Alpha/beta hydrolase fold protein n=1 Tax=Pseudonocardia dioxanivorans (strain ATCC 55486 / DSM 44775 / JCM 13855 / CB1190) TaxID=675635 RepID=F2L6U6_PSEUX|nr:alpha/beta hydrolase [Pseudonocardia dioxanivorans]AEA28818.1 alpha/beta hydrolase fold protein [Pseudonocardia dioxanivorans CB1190]GJF05080.1 hydrolase [Pseudonocardia sp. D17]